MTDPAGAPGRSPRRSLLIWLYHRLYQELAWGYDLVAWVVSAGQWSAWRRTALAYLPETGPILEVGFGTGTLLAELAAVRRPLVGLEPSPAMQQVTGRRLRRLGLLEAVPRVRGIAQHLPFPDGHFAAVLLTFPAEYIFEPQVAAEFARVLRRCPEPATRTEQECMQDEEAGRLVIGPLSVAIEGGLLARLPFFNGRPSSNFLDRWQAMFVQAGLRPRVVAHAGHNVCIFMLIADRVA